MTSWSATFSGRPAHALVLTVTESSTNEAANQSTVAWNLQINPPSPASGSYNLGASPYSVTINGSTYTGTYSYDFRTSTSNLLLRSGNMTVTHDTDGSKSITVSASSAALSPLGTATISAKTVVLTDFTRPPSKPGTPSLSRSGSVVSASTSGSTFYGPSGGYYSWSYLLEGAGSWTGISGSGTSVSFDVGSATANVAAVGVTPWDHTEGSGPVSSYASIIGIPTPPGSIAWERSGHNVSVTVGSSSGSAIDAYYLRWFAYVNGSPTWSTPVAVSAGVPYTYVGLAPAITYYFQSWAHNYIGNGDLIQSDGVFVPAGGKRWDGAAWQYATTAKRWDGTAWVDATIAKRWDGTAWVDLA